MSIDRVYQPKLSEPNSHFPSFTPCGGYTNRCSILYLRRWFLVSTNHYFYCRKNIRKSGTKKQRKRGISMFIKRELLPALIFSTISTMVIIPSHANSQALQATDNRQIPQIDACVDTNGDGLGWYQGGRCRTIIAPLTTPAISAVETPAAEEFPMSARHCIDPDGDGWGWDGQQSCQITDAPTNIPPTPVITSQVGSCIDSDGDGWGWDGESSCQITATSTDFRSTPAIMRRVDRSGSSIPGNCDRINSGDYHITELVTDIFLTAGQSNATGNETDYNPARYADDARNSRIIAWTEQNRWEVADPTTQSWHNGRHPSGHGRFHNHPAFQIARGITDNDSCRVVAFIATAASGMPINHWLNDVDNHYSYILHKVTNALNALPGQHKIDMIWWMQGEADDDEIVDRYFFRLTDLISRFRSQSWFNYDGLFVANETRLHTHANEAIRRLATDGDSFSNFSPGADSTSRRFPSILPAGVHFNAQSLRQIGDLVADQYLYDYLPRVNR